MTTIARCVSLMALAMTALPALAQTFGFEPASPERMANWRRCMSGDADTAIAGCGAVIEAGDRPDMLAIAYTNRARAHYAKGQYGRAIADYDQAIKYQPGHAGYWNGRCFTRAVLGELEAALKDCDESLRLRPGDAGTLDSRALVHLKAGRADAAIADYSAALDKRPRFASALYGRGLARQRKGDQAGAVADMDAARAIRADIAGDFVRYGVR